jgi:hypothetical protein
VPQSWSEAVGTWIRLKQPRQTCYRLDNDFLVAVLWFQTGACCFKRGRDSSQFVRSPFEEPKGKILANLSRELARKSFWIEFPGRSSQNAKYSNCTFYYKEFTSSVYGVRGRCSQRSHQNEFPAASCNCSRTTLMGLKKMGVSLITEFCVHHS